MIVFKEGDNIGVSKLLTFYRKEPFYIQAEYADPLVVPCANPIVGKNQYLYACMSVCTVDLRYVNTFEPWVAHIL